MFRLFLTAGLAAYAWAQQAPPDDVYKVGPDVTLPRLKHKVDPTYSPSALRAQIQGTVLLQVVVNEHGAGQDIAVVSPLGFGLDEKAVEAVARWRFLPAMKDNPPVKVRATVEITFRLTNSSFDEKAEVRRTRFNSIVSKLSLAKDEKPTPDDVRTIAQLTEEKMPASDFIYGLWQMQGNGVTKDVKAGLANIQKAADLNQGPAMYYIGQAQMTGELMPKDEAAGLALMQKAAVLGSKQAKFKLGVMYATGEGVGTDLSRAKRYFRLCAASGTPECQLQLGKLLLKSSPRPDHEMIQGVAWLQLADSHGLTAARTLMAAEVGELTPEQAQGAAKLRSQLEHK